MSANNAPTTWQYDGLGFDPRARDFRRDFFDEETPRHTAAKQKKSGNKATRRDENVAMAEMIFRLTEVMKHMNIMSQDISVARHLCRHLVETNKRAGLAPPCHQGKTEMKEKKAKRDIVCKRCDTRGHHWTTCRRVSCSCGEWHTRESMPLPTCIRGNMSYAGAIGTGRPVRAYPEHTFDPTVTGGEPSASSDELDQGQ